MTRRRPTQSTRRRSRHVARTSSRAKATDPSITRLGFECYRLVMVRTGDAPPALLFAHVRNSNNAMSVFATARAA